MRGKSSVKQRALLYCCALYWTCVYSRRNICELRELRIASLATDEFCPFCVRVQLVLGWKNIPYEVKVHGYGDALGDEDSIKNNGAYQSSTYLTGKKALPVLELADGTMIPESGDIIAFLEDATGPGNVLLPPPSGRADLRTFFAWGGDFATVLKALTLPRQLRMSHLISLATEADRALVS